MLSIILPARSSPALTGQCLASVRAAVESLRLPRQWIVVDDASSGKDDLRQTHEAFAASLRSDEWAVFKRFEQRQHYTGVFAYGMEEARGNLLLFVSNDMVMTTPFLRTLLQVMALDDSYGVVRGISNCCDGFPDIEVKPPCALDTYGAIESFSRYVAEDRGLLHYEQQQFSGDACLIRRRALADVGAMDRRFFGYFGDVDWGVRLRACKYKIICALGAWLMHYGQGHIRSEIETDGAEKANADRLALLQTAYERFREKYARFDWPEKYPGNLDHIDFAELSGLMTLRREAAPKTTNSLNPNANVFSLSGS